MRTGWKITGILLLLAALLAATGTVTSCTHQSQTTTLQYMGRWSYSFPPGLAETDFAYDQDAGLIDAVATTTLKVEGKDYLLLGFVPNAGPGRNSRVFIFDTADPLSPQLVASVAHPDEDRLSYIATSITTADGVLYAGLFVDKGCWRVDVSDPPAPRDLGISDVATNDNMIVSSDLLFSSGQVYDGIIVCRITGSGEIEELSRIDLPTRDVCLAQSGSLLFCGYRDNVTIYDFSDPVAPVTVASLQLTIPADLTTELEGVPMGMSKWQSWQHVLDLQAAGKYVYVATGAGSVRVIDVSDPDFPQEIAQIDIGGFTSALTLADNQLYVTMVDTETGKMGLAVVDVSDPVTPRLAGTKVTDTDFVLGGASFAYCWMRPLVTGNHVYLGGLNYLDVFKIE